LDSIVITTIQPPTESVRSMLNKAAAAGFELIAIADRKTPNVAWPAGARYVSVQEQLDSDFELARIAPFDHYARKNLGYLFAIAHGASVIFDTDDDNAPLESWAPRSLRTSARPCFESGWVNVYRWFSDMHVWPRGLPLEHARHDDVARQLGTALDVVAPIQQGLANGSPDVDAVWRLVMDRDIRFRAADSVFLSEGTWCPFNSQSSWWFSVVHPLMYLPSFVSFRMTDIWRSFVAQRCLWALGYGVVFHAPEMFQDRNPHKLMSDFEEEMPGYLSNEKIRQALEQTSLEPGSDQVADNCHRCYDAMVKAGFIPDREMPLLEAWLRDLRRLANGRN